LAPYGVHGKIVHTPGHTPGSVSVFLDNKTAIIGDLNMSLIIPEKPGRPLFAYDCQTWKASIKKVLDFEPRRIEVTHGNFYILNDYRQFCKAEFIKNNKN
jgi:glyoxylase-like metal-dependent hydrolase (beta-lactamase superfamily II)